MTRRAILSAALLLALCCITLATRAPDVSVGEVVAWFFAVSVMAAALFVIGGGK